MQMCNLGNKGFRTNWLLEITESDIIISFIYRQIDRYTNAELNSGIIKYMY